MPAHFEANGTGGEVIVCCPQRIPQGPQRTPRLLPGIDQENTYKDAEDAEEEQDCKRTTYDDPTMDRPRSLTEPVAHR